MNYWRWNIPVRKSPSDGGCITPPSDFSLAEKLNISPSDLAGIKAYAAKGEVLMKAGEITTDNPWVIDGHELSDLQVYRRWNHDALSDYCMRVLDIVSK